MTEYTKPTKIQNIWAANGDRSPAPDDTKIATGFVVEIPFLEDFNYLEHRQDSALAHINQRGICQWDIESYYLASKSYVQGSNGVVYRAKLSHSGVDPVTDTNKINWEPAFYSQTEVYTKAETHTTFAQRTNNLSDLTNTATARANLGVYSTTETNAAYLAKTSNLSDVTNAAVAFNNIKQLATDSYVGVSQFSSDAELAAGSVTNKAVAPAKLKLGFSVSLGANGYFKFPTWLSGLTIQWGAVSVGADSLATWTYPIPFSNEVLSLQATLGADFDSYSDAGVCIFKYTPLTSARVKNGTATATTLNCLVIGY